GDGYKLEPPIIIPTDAVDISISPDGQITVVRAGSTTKTTVGSLELSTFVNPNGLKLLGGSLYQVTDSSGAPITGLPGENGTGQIIQGYLEASNVDPVKELVTLIKAQQAFELNSQSIQTADQTLQTVANLRRF
ncbi:MAG: flagellar hook-basal body protein, partial [Tepidisphaeraceae bacterium]